jgi:membrane fusion protein (multidrug efflux system)
VTDSRRDWNRILEFTWRILVFLVAVAIIAIVSTNWNRWEGGEGWQRTNDAYLQADLTPIASKVAGYIRELPVQDYERVHKGQVLARVVDDDYRAAAAQAEAAISSAMAQARTLRAQRE